MKKLILVLYSALMIIPAEAQWTQPLHDFYIATSVARRGADLLASTWYGGFFISKDNGFSWSNYETKPILNNINTLYEISTNIVASVHPDAIFTSTDKGSTWVATMQNLPSEVKYFVGEGSTVYAGLRNGVVLKSTDMGLTWAKLNLNLTTLSCMAFYKEYLVIGGKQRMYFLDTVNYVSNNQFNTNKVSKLTDIVTNGNTIIAGTEDEGVFVSADGAKTWEQSVKGLEEYSIIDLEIKDSILYAVNFNGVYKSPNMGKDWFCITLDFPILDVHAIKFIDNNLFMFTEENGMLVSFDMNDPVLASSGLKYRTINTLHNFNEYTFAGVFTGICKSTDRGNKWNPVTKWNLGKEILQITSNNQVIFAAAGWSGVLMSADSSKTWEPSYIGPGNVFVTSVIESGGKVFAGTVRAGIFRCNDNKTDWQEVNSGLSNKEIICLASDRNDIYAGTDGGGVFVSHNSGDSWEELAPALKFMKINSIAVSGDTIAVVIGTGIAMTSTDWGATWKEHYDVLSGIINCIRIFNNKIIAATTDGVLIYNDFYDKWQPLNKGLTSKNVKCLDAAGGLIYAGTDSGGVYMAALADIQTDVSPDVANDTEILIYPNPASDFLYLNIPVTGKETEITITNELGFVLINEIISSNRINIDYLVSGLYFITIEHGVFKQTTKFSVIQ